jgi:2-oxoglutarate ferredoxin oxidoreductase subunit beta
MDKHSRDLHEALQTSRTPLNQMNEHELCPGSKVLEQINQSLR